MPKEIPFAPHSPSWKMCENGTSAYCVLDGRVTDNMNLDFLQKIVERSASEFLGKPAKVSNAFMASDFFCGHVLIIYCSIEKEVENGEK